MEQGDFLIYLYCLCEDQPKLPSISFNQNIKVLPFNDFFAIIELVPTNDFGELPLQKNITNMEWLIPKVNIHEGVIQQLMEETTVLPVKFATIFSQKNSLYALLQANKEKYATNFEKLRNKEEWGVKIFNISDDTWLLQNTDDQEILAMQEAIDIASPGKAFLMKKKLTSLVNAKKNLLYKKAGNELYKNLKIHTVESIQKSILPAQRSTEKMMLNAVFLLEKEEVPTWVQQIENMEAMMGNKTLDINVTGPWPPYHFMN